jgi:oligoribonuclease NrnB/cAMP/cGMP phosphodiesterase (DHH superfamily)
MMEPFQSPLVIFHGGCRDGFAASWVANRFFTKPDVAAVCTQPVEYHAGFFGAAPPDVTGRDVFILDYSYPRPVMQKLINQARRMVVLDHHKTAQAALAGLGSSIHFDMNRSGAGMAWDHFDGGARSWLVDYVEDHDLWRHSLKDSRQVNALIAALPFDFKEWDAQHEMGFRDSVVERGYAILMKIEQYCAEVSKNALLVKFEGHCVPLVNAPQADISELLSGMLGKQFTHRDGRSIATPAFSMGWWQRHDGRFQYSLRSAGNFDVSELARKHGGGGHVNAAGFETDSPVHLWW